MSVQGQKACEMFHSGYNCAQSVLGAYANELGLDEKTAFIISSGFGGGMGRTRNVCGAVSGMIMAADMLYGYDDPKAITEKKETYKMVQKLLNSFKEKNGSIVCGDLLGLNDKQDINPTPSERTAEYYKKRPCALLVKDAADILSDYILEKNKS
ncbi:MAG TPA: C_GCAxxG_C_C family protein [Clostridiales bacterium]|nr:C_GCAxxG_C_C family protein [Clostridiales bacterium]